MKDALAQCGFPPCSADYILYGEQAKMAPAITPLEDIFFGLDRQPHARGDTEFTYIPFRAVHSDFLLAERLRAFLGHEIKDKNLFLAHMAGVVVQNRPPLKAGYGQPILRGA